MRPGKNKKQSQRQPLMIDPLIRGSQTNSCLACEQRGDRRTNLRPLCSTPKVTYNDQDTLTMRIRIMNMVTNSVHPSTHSGLLRGLCTYPLGARFSTNTGFWARPFSNSNAISDRLEIRNVLQNMPIEISHLQHVHVGTWILMYQTCIAKNIHCGTTKSFNCHGPR